MKMEFKHLKDCDINEAYDLLCERIEYLKMNGINQYDKVYPPFEIYLKRQENNENYGLYNNGLVAIVSLMKNYIPEGWKEEIKSEEFVWLTSLFVKLSMKRKNIGSIIIEKIHNWTQTEKINEIYLDCYYGDGFLEDYYTNFGYRRIIKKIVEYPSREFEAVLMKKTFSPNNGFKRTRSWRCG